MAARKKATDVRCLSKTSAATIYKMEFSGLEVGMDGYSLIIEPIPVPSESPGGVAWVYGRSALSRENAIRLRDLLNNIIEVTE